MLDKKLIEDLMYNEKTLHIGFRPQINEKDYNGIIYNPKAVYSKIGEDWKSSEEIFENFFNKNIPVIIFPILTEQSPDELAKLLNQDYKTEHLLGVGGIIKPIKIAGEQSKKLIEDLSKNPKKYYYSEWKVRKVDN